MRSRADLHALLKSLTDNVYFQPPPSLQMDYPCIVYERNKARTTFADDKPYTFTQGYQVVVIDRNPDSDIPIKVAFLPMCIYDRFYTADNLNHDAFTMFF